MANFATALKDEVRRLARKEIRDQVGTTKQMVSRHRHDLADLKRQITELEKKLEFLQDQERQRSEKPQVSDDTLRGARFSSRSVRAQRKRLDLSAEEFGKLLGVSAQTVYLWERGKTRPQQQQLASLVAVRSMGKREATRRLELIESGSNGASKPKRGRPRRKAR